MPNLPIEAQYTTGRTLHVVRHNPDGRVWNANSGAWEAYNSSNWADYAIPMTEQAGSCYYRAAQTIPDLDVNTTDALYERISPTPTLPSSAGGDIPLGTGQSQGANVVTIAEEFEAAENLSLSALTMEQGSVQAGAITTQSFISDLGSGVVDAYRGRVILFTNGTLFRASAIIIAFDPDTKLLTFTTLPGVPAQDDTFIVV